MGVYLRDGHSVGFFTGVKIGDGNYPLQEGKVNIPSYLGTVVRSLSEFAAKMYPDISSIKEKSIERLCEKNDKAAAIDDILFKSFEGEEIEYRSFDSVVQMDDAVHYP